MLEKNGLKESYDASYADLRIKLDLIATKEKQLESSYQAKMDDLTNLYHSKLREQGVDENILKQAEMKIKAAIAQHTKVKGYESILAEYDMWKKNHYQYKQNHIEDMNQALKLVSEYSHNLSKLESELEQSEPPFVQEWTILKRVHKISGRKSKSWINRGVKSKTCSMTISYW